jgi:hypothetical protein
MSVGLSWAKRPLGRPNVVRALEHSQTQHKRTLVRGSVRSVVMRHGWQRAIDELDFTKRFTKEGCTWQLFEGHNAPNKDGDVRAELTDGDTCPLLKMRCEAAGDGSESFTGVGTLLRTCSQGKGMAGEDGRWRPQKRESREVMHDLPAMGNNGQ